MKVHNKFHFAIYQCVKKRVTTAVILENLQHTTVLAVVVFRRVKNFLLTVFEDKKRTYGSENGCKSDKTLKRQ